MDFINHENAIACDLHELQWLHGPVTFASPWSLSNHKWNSSACMSIGLEISNTPFGDPPLLQIGCSYGMHVIIRRLFITRCLIHDINLEIRIVVGCKCALLRQCQLHSPCTGLANLSLSKITRLSCELLYSLLAVRRCVISRCGRAEIKIWSVVGGSYSKYSSQAQTRTSDYLRAWKTEDNREAKTKTERTLLVPRSIKPPWICA